MATISLTDTDSQQQYPLQFVAAPFLVWPLALVAMVILSPLIILSVVLLWPLGLSKPLLLTGPVLFRLFCSMRGLEIVVENSSDQVLISFR